MKRGSTLFLKGVVYALGLGVLALCVFALPGGLTEEGGGDYRPIVALLYVSAIPFFVALYQSHRLLNLIDKNAAFSMTAVEALKKIKYCGIVISALFAAVMPYAFVVADRDDAPGTVAIGLVIIFASTVIAIFAGVLQKLLKNVVEIKSENELTV